MKKVLLSLAVMAIATTAMGQKLSLLEWNRAEPADIKSAKEWNLKGNVLSVKYSQYEYMENFGEPTAGKKNWEMTTYYDENGRPLISEKISNGNINGYIHEYITEGVQTTVNTVGFLNASPERHTRVFQKGILISHTYYHHGRIDEKLVGKHNPDKSWAFTCYNSRGETQEKSTRTFNANGQIVKMEYSQYGPYNNKYSGYYINTPLAGTYKYNSYGFLCWYQEPKAPKDLYMEYLYNDKGDLTNSVATWTESGRPGTPKKKKRDDEKKEYSDYVYDSNGNWIQRVVWNHQFKPKYIEKREIEYCASKEELKAKAAEKYTSTKKEHMIQ